MTKEEILERVVERVKDNEYDYEIETFLKRKEVNPEDFKSIIENARALVLEERLKVMPKKNLTVFIVLVVLVLATFYLFAFYLPTQNVSRNKTILSIIGTAFFCFFSFLSLVYFNTWKPEFLKIRDKPKIDFTFMALMFVPAVIVYFIFSECISSGADKILKATQIDAVGTVIDGGVTEVKRVLRSGGASFASITVEFETKEGTKVRATEDISSYRFKDFYLGQQLNIVYSSEDPSNIDLLIDDKSIKELKGTQQRSLQPQDLIRFMSVKKENIKAELDAISYGWEQKEEAWINEKSNYALMANDNEVKLITAWGITQMFPEELEKMGFKKIATSKDKKENKMEILFGDKLYENDTYYFQIKTLVSGGQQMSAVLVNKK
ncbi:hypothetical protein [Flavobacterium sp.]|uniref:hypothetical protein n=1 Tax=Flavobacterium sp. TaxID=239 RepID=UPI0026202577|nr:hypothetical protein [Flavobacterium sp.]